MELKELDELSLAELEKLERIYFIQHDGWTTEFDKSINDISRVKIKQFQKERGACYLGRINEYDENAEIKLTLYERQVVYNFEYTFIVPHDDPKLVELLKKYHKRGNSPDLTTNQITEITNRIYETGGMFLYWS
ncbi:hypothetical protein M2451_004064 [Dysgonomonas sp. PFB1-18]|uniref:hypothetical protein n=1 Tax=unclassified Dysgonomonas TaxID=2630389 RepID=UPI00247391A6|nr:MULTISPECIES: hypothetical protein [unclassified Dysgonomonas]MDH6310897.1 hypothetical protein [Dysgonomonas sp. PF1-14]MDH6341034.1 hypothetical protein [Dysgonomonas sp. PF1-16]MDH6382717.1 hypothetical protein [Dysgonomonas sp. PFB1-18]MDH6400020.1 hypothetical protein [Dysgonomonas sp. PF1-23]